MKNSSMTAIFVGAVLLLTLAARAAQPLTAAKPSLDTLERQQRLVELQLKHSPTALRVRQVGHALRTSPSLHKGLAIRTENKRAQTLKMSVDLARIDSMAVQADALIASGHHHEAIALTQLNATGEPAASDQRHVQTRRNLRIAGVMVPKASEFTP